MQILIDYAKGLGLREVTGDVLAGNQPMLALCRSLGFQSTHMDGDVVRVRLALR
jgi:acetyltransferase